MTSNFKPSNLKLLLRNRHKLRLLVAKGQAVPAQAELDRIAQWRSANDFHIRAARETHFQQTPANVRIATDRDDAPAATQPELVQRAGIRIATMIAAGQIAGFLHGVAHSGQL